MAWHQAHLIFNEIRNYTSSCHWRNDTHLKVVDDHYGDVLFCFFNGIMWHFTIVSAIKALQQTIYTLKFCTYQTSSFSMVIQTNVIYSTVYEIQNY